MCQRLPSSISSPSSPSRSEGHARCTPEGNYSGHDRGCTHTTHAPRGDCIDPYVLQVTSNPPISHLDSVHSFVLDAPFVCQVREPRLSPRNLLPGMPGARAHVPGPRRHRPADWRDLRNPQPGYGEVYVFSAFGCAILNRVPLPSHLFSRNVGAGVDPQWIAWYVAYSRMQHRVNIAQTQVDR